MPTKLKRILEIKNPVFDLVLRQLEKSTGNSSVDIRLIADITRKAHTVMRHFKLDTIDTTTEELYLTLISAVKNNDTAVLLGDCDYVLLIVNGETISFNLIDIIESYHHQLKFKDRSIRYGQRSLKGELVDRYINHSRTNNATIYELARSADLLED